MNDNRNDNRNEPDVDLRTMLLATGDRPTDEFRNQLHDTLISAAGGRDTVQIAPRSAIAQRRPVWPILAAAAAVAALVAGIAVVGRGGSDPLVPSTDPVSTEPQEASADVTATDLVDRPWVGDQRDDVIVPTIRFTASELVYTDACGEYSGAWDPETMAIGELKATSTFDDCAPAGTGGDLVGATISIGDDVIALWAFDEVIATFTDAAALGSAGETDLIGWWELDGHLIRFEPGTMYLENCSDTWGITDHLVTYRTLAKSECFSGFATRHGEVFNQMLGSADLTAIRSGSDLLLVDGDTTLRLTSAAVRDADLIGAEGDLLTAVEPLAGTRWIVDNVDGTRYEWSRLPYVEFQASSQPMITGFNGCIDYTATGTIEETDDRQTLRIDGREGRLLRCAVDRAVEPISGQIVASPNPGVRMTWTTATGDVTEFVALDSLPLIGADRLPGRWMIWGDSTSFVDITPDEGSGMGTLSIGSCAVSFELGARLTTDGWPDPGSCLDDPEDVDTVRLIEALAAGVEARWEPFSQALVLANDRFVFRLGAGSTPLDRTRIDFATGSSFGFRPGDIVSSDDVLGEVSAVLGVATHDTGWFVTDSSGNLDGDCMAGRTTRTLWWGDLSMSFWRRNLEDGTTDEVLWTWTVGDTRASRIEDRREPYLPPADARSGLTTGADIPISVGSTEEELAAAYGSRLPRSPATPLDDGTTSWSSAGDAGWELHGVSAIVLTRDGVVIGFGSAITFC